MLRTGEEHLKSIRDGRVIYIGDERVDDVTRHPAFRNAARTVAALYDMKCDPAARDVMSYEEDGSRHSIYFLRARAREDLQRRMLGHRRIADFTYGMFGRSPDHVASFIAGMAMKPDALKPPCGRPDNLLAYYRYARDNELDLTYVLLNPQADRSKAACEQQDPHLTAGVVDEDGQGVTIRGAKMLATGGIAANEVLAACIQPLRAGDERYAVSFAVPMNAKGLKILSRKSYEESASSVFDNPLASRFDENDSILYFDDVKVPWERVFINQDTAMCQKQFHATPAHVYQNYQAQIRLMVKMRFLTGLARRIAETNGVIDFPQVKETLGSLAAYSTMVDALVHAMEVKGRMRGAYFVPDGHTLYSAQVLTQQLYAQVMTGLRELAGGGLIMLPSSVLDFANPELRELIGKTQQSPAASSEGRVKFFKLAWDAVGSEFASRHTQYEMFYAGAPFVTKGHSFRTFDWDRGAKLVDSLLDSYSLEDELSQERPAAA